MDPRIRRYFWQRPRTHREVITEGRISSLELFLRDGERLRAMFGPATRAGYAVAVLALALAALAVRLLPSRLAATGAG